ncbi:MAG: hypothetical protein U9O97_06370 [Elusimicrobiota bacterium]|nr:hypothetical protein [Elusimicrobiota bacterium]
MGNSAKNKIKALIAHTLFLTCAGSLVMFRTSSGRYFERLKNSIFITAYTECHGEEDLAALQNKIETVAGVKKVVTVTEKEIFAALKGALTRKDILSAIQNVRIPVMYKIYPRTLDYKKFGKIAADINAFNKIKYSDTGGKAVKKLFLFASDFKTAVAFITVLLLLSALTAAAAAAASMKYLSEKFRFLSERNISRKDMLLNHAAETVIIPLSALIVSILIMLAVYQARRGDIIFFLTPPQVLLLAVFSAFPCAVRLTKRD